MADGTGINPDLPRVEWGAHLRGLRVRRSMSQWDLAVRAGVHPATISRLEHGHHAASKETRRRLARALKVRSL